MSLNGPFAILEQRNVLRNHIEQQKDVLLKTNHWPAIFTLNDRKKHPDHEKKKMMEDMNELNHLDGQINQAHKTISDEMAHFQNIHPKQMIKSLRQAARSALAMEKHKLSVLEQTANKWQSHHTLSCI